MTDYKAQGPAPAVKQVKSTKTPSPVFLALVAGITTKHGIGHWTGATSALKARVQELKRAEENILAQLEGEGA